MDLEMIQWEPLVAIEADENALKRFLTGVQLDASGVAATWMGVSGSDSSQKFVLQARAGMPAGERQATLVSQSMGERGEYNPRVITLDQIADAAGFLGYQWFNYLPAGPGRALFSEEMPPDDGIEAFPAKRRPTA